MKIWVLFQMCLSRYSTFAPLRNGRPPAFDLTPPPTLDVSEGGTVTLASRANGAPAPTHRWLRDGVPLEASNRRVIGVDSPTLTLVGSHPTTHAGVYTCVAENMFGRSDSGSCSVHVAPLTRPSGDGGSHRTESRAASTMTEFTGGDGEYEGFRGNDMITAAAAAVTAEDEHASTDMHPRLRETLEVAAKAAAATVTAAEARATRAAAAHAMSTRSVASNYHPPRTIGAAVRRLSAKHYSERGTGGDVHSCLHTTCVSPLHSSVSYIIANV